jgi:hypothetical protein
MVMERVCKKEGCNVEFEVTCADEKYCPYHQKQVNDAYDNFVDPLHMYHSHGDGEDFSHSPSDKR